MHKLFLGVKAVALFFIKNKEKKCKNSVARSYGLYATSWKLQNHYSYLQKGLR